MLRPNKNGDDGAKCTRLDVKLILVALISFLMGRVSQMPQTILCDCGAEMGASTSSNEGQNVKLNEMDESLIAPFEETALKEFLPNKKTDSYNYFYRWIQLFGNKGPNPPKDMDEMPLLHIWPIYFEAYHNHWQRFRGKEVVFMEIGVQSGGKIPMLRDYFGPGFKYVGIDINPGCRKFHNGDWVHIEIGDSGDPNFFEYIKNKYPRVDLFLDDGGHTMDQQRVAMREMLPHVQPNGVYMCEDLSTSWSKGFGGMPMKDSRNVEFLDKTMFGFVHRTIDWLNAGWVAGKVMSENFNLGDFFGANEFWWKNFHDTVKSIHVYSQLVVYEKGFQEKAFHTKTVGSEIPYENKGKTHEKTPWDSVVPRVQTYTKSHW